MRQSLQRVSRNLILMYIIRICTVSAALIVPNLVIYVQQYGVTQDLFFWLETAFALTFLIFQIPTGRFADSFGRKRSMQVGSLILPISQLCYLFGEDFWAFIAAEVLGAIGFAFLSGADEAIFYDSLVFLKKKHLHAKLWGRAFLCGFLAMSLGNFIGGLLAPFYPHLPFALATLGFCFLALLTLCLEEPRHKKLLEGTQKVSAYEVIKVCLIKNSQIRWLMLFPGVISVSMQSLLWVYQSYFLLNGVSENWHGVLIASFNLTAGMTSFCAFRIQKRVGDKLVILLPIILVSVCMFALAVEKSITFIPLLLIQQCVRGFLPSIFSSYLNKALPTHYRATALSIKSSCELLYYCVLLQVTRLVVASAGVREAFLVHAIILSLFGGIIVLSWLKDMRKYGDIRKDSKSR